MKSIILAGEDAVTKTCLRKIINHCDPETIVLNELPARGGQLKSLINNLNKLSIDIPVILLTDLDNNDCAPSLKSTLLQGIEQNNNFIFNIACDEAEAWLMSDKKNFSKYFKIPISSIPQKSNMGNRRKPYYELDFKYKSSLFLVNEVIKKSKDEKLIKMMTPDKGSYKGPEYNTAILPFINSSWDIEQAKLNSDSLTKTVDRINRFLISTM